MNIQIGSIISIIKGTSFYDTFTNHLFNDYGISCDGNIYKFEVIDIIYNVDILCTIKINVSDKLIESNKLYSFNKSFINEYFMLLSEYRNLKLEKLS